MDQDRQAWGRRVVEAAARVGEADLPIETIQALVSQVCAVLAENDRLHLTSIRDEVAFVERHLIESMLGAGSLPAGAAGPLLDLGSGNGYPGVPVAALRPGLEPWLAESNGRKAAFLKTMLESSLRRGGVLHRHVERPADLGDLPPLAAIVSRAMGGWQKVLPRLAPALAEDGLVLLWGGAEVEAVARRRVWMALREVDKIVIPHRDRAWIWVFRPRDVKTGCQITSVAPDSYG